MDKFQQILNNLALAYYYTQNIETHVYHKFCNPNHSFWVDVLHL